MNENWEQTVWKIFDAYYAENNIATMQIKSYNHFITFGISQIAEQEEIFLGEQQHKIKFSSIKVERPYVIEEDRKIKLAFPGDARSRDLTYDAAIFCDIVETFFQGDKEVTKIHPMQVIGRMPVMLRSCICNLSFMNQEERIKAGECPSDNGGYFIVKGNERVLTGQLRANYNTIFVIKQTSSEKKYSHIAEVRSMSAETGHSVLVQAMISHDEKSINFSLPSIKEHIPVGIVFKAMGYLEAEQIIDVIALPDIKDPEKFKKIRNLATTIINNASICSTQKESLKYIGQHAMHTISDDKKEPYAWQVVETEQFPHLGISSSLKEQAYFLGSILRKLLLVVLGLRSEDDRDNLALKRIDISGALMHELFRNLFKKFVNSVKTNLEKKKRDTDALPIILRTKNITKGLHQCLANGNWSVQKNSSYVKTGVSQVLDRMTYGSSCSHLRRILLPVGKEGKNAAIRMIHPSQFGYVCPSETPEGHKVGIVLNFSLFTEVSTRVPIIDVKRVLAECKFIKSVEKIDIKKYKDLTPLFLNGVIIGFVSNQKSAVQKLLILRENNKIEKEVSISYDPVDNEIRIYCDEGRFLRPLLTVKNNKLTLPIKKKYTWTRLIEKNYIQFIDPSEAEWSVIAMTPASINTQENNYCEIHPCTMLGIMGSVIPFPDHSQSPRNCYQCSMGKQALGVPLLSYNLRTDTLLRILHYSQKPIIFTKPSQYLGFNEMVSGMNAITAVMPYYGYNQEDSIIANKSAGERGFMVLTSYRTIDDSEKKRDTYSQEKICLPPESTPKIKPDEPGYFRRKNANYSFLDENGIVKPTIPYERKCDNSKCEIVWYPGRQKFCPDCKKIGTEKRGGQNIAVKKGDVIIGKIITTTTRNSHEKIIDVSRVIEDGEEGIIDRVHVYVTPNGYRLVQVVIRRVNEAILGDKLASRSAQKGTIGFAFHEIDMPFTNQGIIPEIIINPLCMPSRMTINQLIECPYAKICAVEGIYGDATPFTERSNNIADKLMKDKFPKMDKSGFKRDGWEKMRAGMTGEEIHHEIFIGPTFYQRLKHTVADKLHARPRGPCSTLTRQPLEGRARDGGLRFGEMERDCMIAHGASEFLRERLFTVSDKFQVPVCELCGFMTNTTTECQLCKSNQVAIVNLPYASKLMIQELTQLCLKIRIFPAKTR